MKRAINLPLLIVGCALFGMGMAGGGNWFLLPACIFIVFALISRKRN